MSTAAIIALIGGIVSIAGTATAGGMQAKAAREAREASLKQAETVRADIKEQRAEEMKFAREKMEVGLQQGVYDRLNLSKEMRNAHLQQIGGRLMAYGSANAQWRNAMQDLFRGIK